ncbi:innexin inx1 [Anthonomus grandis grandis]|uniref:innexin inx1 n=1 Tax=Anthonomus grandis grandis TaxID=2921223 RepID=UPI0021663902|nr:innexin inx1 [Anthonomus grandis grandis]
MYKLLGGLANYLKYQDIVTDCAVFRMHNLFTTALLMACSLIITASQYVGNPIQCISDGAIPSHVINTFCWISSTFTMPDAFKRQVGVEVPHLGLANDFSDKDAQKFYTYYQWVCFVLFFQAIACYTPKVIWDSFESGLMKMLVMGLHIGVCRKDEKEKKKEVILEYLKTHVKRHNLYALRYWACECLCLINIIIQMYCMNKFFDGEFINYGWRVMNYSQQPQEERVDPMVYVFPRVTKCIFHKYGPTGTIQKHDSLCVLPLNIVNEKTYVFIWFWYVLLLSMLTILVIYRVIIIALPKIRPRILHAKHRSIPIEVCNSLCKKVDMGDWWILLMLGTNMDPLVYREIITELVKNIELNKDYN